MRYIKLQDNKPVNYSIEQFTVDYPNAVVYSNSAMPDPMLLVQYNVYPLITINPPAVKEAQTAEEGVPSFNHGEWYQTWVVRDFTEQELTKIINGEIPVLVSPQAPAAMSGIFASEETVNQRHEICKSCPSYTRLKICAECGCIVPFKIKITEAVCPLNKWAN
jgi:hypothetical protein